MPNSVKKIIEAKVSLRRRVAIVIRALSAALVLGSSRGLMTLDSGATVPSTWSFHKRLGPIVLPSSVTGPNAILVAVLT